MAAKTTPRFYIFHGDDDYRLSQAVDKMRGDMNKVDSAGLNTALLDGTQVNAAEVISAVSAFPFLADRRLVIVRGMLAHITRRGAGDTGKKQRDRLTEDLPNLPDWARLVFVETKTIKHKLVKLAQESEFGYEKEFAAPKDMTRWLMGHAQREYDTTLEPMAARALASVIDGDLRRADNELLKLASYGGGEPITEAMVSLLTPYTTQTRIWDMIDMMANGRGDDAMRMMHAVLDDPNEDPFRVWALFVRHFRLMLLAKEHLDSGEGGSMAAALGMKDFQVRKLPGQVKGFRLEELETIYRKLLDYDTKIKTGGMTVLLALDVLVATVARG